MANLIFCDNSSTKLKAVAKTTCCVNECAFLLPKSTQSNTTQKHQGKTGGASPGCLCVFNVVLFFPPPFK